MEDLLVNAVTKIGGKVKYLYGQGKLEEDIKTHINSENVYLMGQIGNDELKLVERNGLLVNPSQ